MKTWCLIVIGSMVAVSVKAEDFVGWGGAPMYTSDYFSQMAFSNAAYANIATFQNAVNGSSDQGDIQATPASTATKVTLASKTTSKWPKKLAMKFPKQQRKA